MRYLMLFFGLTKKLELDWDETEIRLRDDAIRPNWVLCATATKPAKLSLEENHEALGEVGTPFECSADSWSGGVVGGDEEGTHVHNKNTHWFGELGAHGAPIFGTENLFFFARQENCEI